MGERKRSRRGKAIRRLRQDLGWSEEQLGEPNGLSRKVVHNLENGWRHEPARREAEALVASMGLPAVALDMADAFGRWVEAAAPPPEPVSPEEEDARRARFAAGLFGFLVAQEEFPVLLWRTRTKRFVRDRRQAEERFERLRRLATWEERREHIQNAEDYQTWALVERLAHESVHAAADRPAEALAWADLALFTVPFVQGSDSRRRRLEGYATFCRANGLCAGNDLDGSEAAFEKGWALWNAGEDDFLPLDEGRPLDLEASLRREQRSFQKALDLLTAALELSPAERAGRILLKRAATLEQLGDVEAAVEALTQARPHVERTGEPRDLWVLLFNLSVNFWHLARFEEAGERLAEAREVAIRLGYELDLARTLWLAAKLDGSLGRTAEAAAALEQVFDDLIAYPLPYDAALAGLDLAVLHLEQDHTREVMTLAQRMEKIFVSLRIEREALAALLVFCEAARRQEATMELARRTAEVIKTAQREQRAGE